MSIQPTTTTIPPAAGPSCGCSVRGRSKSPTRGATTPHYYLTSRHRSRSPGREGRPLIVARDTSKPYLTRGRSKERVGAAVRDRSRSRSRSPVRSLVGGAARGRSPSPTARYRVKRQGY